MPQGADLTLGVLFAGRIDASFQTAVNNLRNSLSGLASTMTRSGQAATGASAGAQGLGNQLGFVGRQIGQVHGGFQRLTAAMKVTASYGLASMFLFGIVRSLKEGVIQISEFDQALKNLQAITSAANPEIAALRDVILKVAETTKYSAVEVSESAITLGQAGFSAAESLDVLGAVANLATGTLSTMKETSDLLTSALRAFGEKASQASRYSDIFAKAINKSKLDVQKLRVAFNYLGPVASQVGLDLEKTAAATMLLANAGLRGSTIGTGMRRVLQLLVAPTEKLRVLMEGAGIDMKKINPSVSSMSDVIFELQKILGDTVEPTERARRAFELFGLRGANVAAVLAKAGREGFEAMLYEVYETGAALRMAEKQMEGISVMAKNLKDRFVNLAIAIGEGGIADAFRFSLPIMRNFVSLLTELADSAIGRIIVAITTLTTVLGLLRLVIRYVVVEFAALAAGSTVAAVKMYIAQYGILATVLSAAGEAAKKLVFFLRANPWILIATVISAAAVAIYSFKRQSEEAIPKLEKLGVQLDQHIVKLKDHKKQLEKSKDNSIAYRAALQRLITDYPELANEIDIVNGKFLDQGAALDELISKYETMRLQNLAETFSKQLSKISGLSNTIKRLEIDLQQLKKHDPGSTWAINKRTQEIKNLSRELNDLKKNQEFTFKRIGDVLLTMGLTTQSTFDQITNKIIEVFGVSEEEAKDLMLYITSYYDRLRLIKRTQDEMKKALSGSQADELKKMGDRWLDLYNDLDDLRKADLIETIADMKKKMDKLYETADELGWTEEQLQARLTQLQNETYFNFVEKESAKEKRARQTAQEILKAYEKAFSGAEKGEIAEAEARAADRRQQVKNDVTDNAERAKLIKQINETLAQEIVDIQEKYAQKRADLESEITSFTLKATDKRLEEEILAAEEKARNLKERVNDEIADEIVKAEKIAEIERALQAEIARLRQEHDDKGAGTKRERLRNLEEEYRIGLITIEQYYNELDRLRSLDLISEQQYFEQRRKIQNSNWQAFKNGLDDAKKAVLSWSEFYYKMGTEVVEEVSSNLTSAWWDFVEGTKDAKEAFADFAKNTLKWLSELIVKRLLYNAVSGIFTSIATRGQTPSMVDQFWLTPESHGGGVIGEKAFNRRRINPMLFANAPRLHYGLRADEYPAILQRGEEVLSKRDVAQSKKEKVVVIVNEAPPGTMVTEKMEGPDIRKIVIDINSKDIASGGTMDKMLRSVYGLRRVTAKR